MSDSPLVSPGVEGDRRNSVGDSTSSPASEHLTENSSPHPDNAPFQASVEDCPEEENAVTGTPRPVARSPAGMTPAAPAEPQHEVNVEGQPGSQEHSMPAFIQLSGPSHDEHAQIQPGALHYLDPASPVLTQEAIQRSVSESTHVAQPVATSPSVLSHSSVPSSNRSDVFSQGGHRDSFLHDGGSWGFDFDDTASQVSRKQFGGPPYHSQGQPAVPNAYPQSPVWPGSPHSQYSHPHASPFPAHTMPDPHQRPPIPPPQHNPWPPHQRPAVSGYQCLAAILTGEFYSQPKVLPIYRRFETLNHRLLLQMQDEIVELEQQLDQLDESDSHARMTPNGPWPASRRSEVSQRGQIYFDKQRLFGEIGVKLQNYYTLLESFRTTQCFSCPAQHEVADYRDFFAKQQLIAEPETRFLDRESDLISLNTVEYEESYRDPKGGASRRGDATPTPQSMSAFGSPQVAKAVVESRPPTRRPASSRRPLTDFAYAVLGAVAAPLLSFSLISGFLERMVIVGIVFAFGTALVVQSSVLTAGPDMPGWTECSACAVIYCVFMGVVAWSFA